MFYIHAILILATLILALLGMVRNVGGRRLGAPLALSGVFALLAIETAHGHVHQAVALVLAGVALMVAVILAMYLLAGAVNGRRAMAIG